MASWNRFNTPPSAEEIAHFLGQVDNGISTVKMVATLAKTNLEFAEMLMVGFINPMCIAVNYLADSIEGFVNDIFQTGVYHLIIDPTNVPAGTKPLVAPDGIYQFPGSLLTRGLAISYDSLQGLLDLENASANKTGEASAGTNTVDNQKVRGAKEAAILIAHKQDLIRVYESRADLFIKQKSAVGFYDGASQATKKKDKIIAMVLDVSRTGGYLTPTIMKVIEENPEYGDLGKEIVKDYYKNTISEDAASSAKLLGEGEQQIGQVAGISTTAGVDDSIFRTSRNFIGDYERKAFGYIAQKASLTGLVKMGPQECFSALAESLYDEGDMNRPGSPHFGRHLELDGNLRKEERIDNIKGYFALKKKSHIVDALVSNAGSLPDVTTPGSVASNKLATLRDQLASVKSELTTIENTTSTIYCPYGAVKKDKYGRPRLMGYDDKVDMKKKGYFFESDYERSKSADLRSGSEMYSAFILYAGAPTISTIPTEFLEYLGLIFGGPLKDYCMDVAGKISDIWTQDNQPRKIFITESCRVTAQMVSVSPGYAARENLPGRMPKVRLVKEEQYKFNKGDIIYGQGSENTFIVIQNLNAVESKMIDFDDEGNSENVFQKVMEEQRQLEVEAGNPDGGVTQYSAAGMPLQFQVDPEEPIPYTDQTLLVMPYNNDQEKGKFEPQDGEAFSKGEFVYLAAEGDDGAININKNVGGKESSFVIGKYVMELTEPDPKAYRLPVSTPPDFGPKYTVADMFPEQAGVLRATILGFCDMLRGFAANSSSTLGVIIDMLKQLIAFITEIEKSFLEFLNWIKSLVKLADMNIYTTTVSARGIDNFSNELAMLAQRPGAPPSTLEYSTCVMFLGTTADMAGFARMLSSADAFKNFEAAIQDTKDRVDTMLKNFEKGAKEQMKAVQARSDQFSKTLSEGRDDLFNTLSNPMSIANQIEDLGNLFTSEVADRLGLGDDDSGDDRLGGDSSGSNISAEENPRFQVSSRGVGEFDLSDFDSGGEDAINFEASRLAAGYREEAARGFVDSRFLGLDDGEFLDMGVKKEYYWIVKIARENRQTEIDEEILFYKLWWGKETDGSVREQTQPVVSSSQQVSIDETGTLVTTDGASLTTITGTTTATYEKLTQIEDFPVTTGIDTEIPLEVEVNVGANVKPSDATHLLLYSYGHVEKTIGGLSYTFEAENEHPYAMEIMSLRPEIPEIVVDENTSSVSISENKIMSLQIEITDKDESASGSTSSTLGYSIFLADESRKTFSEPFATLIRTNDVVNLDLTDVEVDPFQNPGWYYLAVLAENQNGYSGGAFFNLSRISAPLDNPKGIDFIDTNVTAGLLTGTVEVTPGTHTSQNGVDPFYKLFFGQYNPVTNTVVTVGSQLDTDVNFRVLNANGKMEFSLLNETIPSGITHFVTYSSIKKVSFPAQEIYHTSSFFTGINDLGAPPNFPPSGLSFADTDKTIGQVSGQFIISPSQDDQLVDNYVVYYADVEGQVLDGAGNQGLLSATAIHDDAKEELYPTVTGVAIPQGAVYFQAYSKNAYGVGQYFVRIPIIDPKYPTEPGEISEIKKDNVRLITNF